MAEFEEPKHLEAFETGWPPATGIARVRARPLTARVFDTLVSVKFAVTVIIVVAVACVVGTLLPQDGEVGAYVQRHPGAVHQMELLGRLGLTQVFSSWWFLALLCLLASTVAACSTRRLATARRTTGFARRRAVGSMLAHISILLILSGGVIRGVWGEKGTVELRQGQTQRHYAAASGTRELPFALHLTKFEVEHYAPPAPANQPDAQRAVHTHAPASVDQLLIEWPERRLSARIPVKVGFEQVFGPPGEPPTAENLFRVKFLNYLADFYLDPATKEAKTRSDEPRNPAILVEELGPGYKTERWLFAQFPDSSMHGSKPGAAQSPLRLTFQRQVPAPPAADSRPAAAGPIKSFRSTVSVIEGGQEVQTRTIEVNRPLGYRGYSFYQSGYNPEDLAWTSLQVVCDPGVPLVYAGFGFMIVGLFTLFYLNPVLAAREKAGRGARAAGPRHQILPPNHSAPLTVAPASEIP